MSQTLLLNLVSLLNTKNVTHLQLRYGIVSVLSTPWVAAENPAYG